MNDKKLECVNSKLPPRLVPPLPPRHARLFAMLHSSPRFNAEAAHMAFAHLKLRREAHSLIDKPE
jgi:hypothetical protein